MVRWIIYLSPHLGLNWSKRKEKQKVSRHDSNVAIGVKYGVPSPSSGCHSMRNLSQKNGTLWEGEVGAWRNVEESELFECTILNKQSHTCLLQGTSKSKSFGYYLVHLDNMVHRESSDRRGSPSYQYFNLTMVHLYHLLFGVIQSWGGGVTSSYINAYTCVHDLFIKELFTLLNIF